MGNKFIKLIMVLGFMGSGTAVYAISSSDSWLAKGTDARNREDYPKAFQCFKVAAEAGNAKAEYNLGYCYFTGQGVVHDDGEAVKWFQKSAEQGDAQGEYALGTCYENGWSVRTDQEKAKENYQKAAQQGFAGAQAALKRLETVPSTGSGQTTEPPAASVGKGGGNEAADWVNQGDVELNKKSYSEAISLFQKAADAGNADGYVGLGSCYLAEAKGPNDTKLAVKWLRKAADAGNPTGQAMLGGMYKDGIGVKKNLKKAKELFQKAAAQGNKAAQESLSGMAGG